MLLFVVVADVGDDVIFGVVAGTYQMLLIGTVVCLLVCLFVCLFVVAAAGDCFVVAVAVVVVVIVAVRVGTDGLDKISLPVGWPFGF